jgi:raffinose/stachyose/melibiose transport system substrate-binding protein
MAFNVDTFDEKTKDFILYVIENYGAKYAAKMQMSPLKNELPADVEFTDLYKKINADMNDFGYYFMKPWDTYLDSATNTILQDNLLLLASGDMDAETFISLVDNSIAQNTK